MGERQNASTSLIKEESSVVVNNDEDRLSCLPNHVAHHILSFLSIKDIGILSLISKKIEQLCLSIPSLDIDDSIIYFPQDSVQITQFMDFLVHFIRGRRGAKMTNLRIYWCATNLKYKEVFRIVWLLNHAMECQVNELNLNLKLESGVVFVMPSDVFCCESLRCLRISLNDGALELPYLHGFAHLRSLGLYCLAIDDSFGEKILSACKFLEKLSLHNLSGLKKFKISSPSLLDLMIIFCSFEHIKISTHSLQILFLSRNTGTSMNVYAPNLLDLSCDATSCNYSFVENPSLLHTVRFTSNEGHYWRIKLNTLLPNIVQVSNLCINVDIIKALNEDGCNPPIFNNLHTLKLQLFGKNQFYVQEIASFLQGVLCTLKILIIENNGYDYACSASGPCSYAYLQTNFWESQNLRLVEGLEELEIRLCGSYEERLLEYLLEKAKKLKKITIFFEKSMSSTTVWKLMAVVAPGASLSMKGDV